MKRQEISVLQQLASILDVPVLVFASDVELSDVLDGWTNADLAILNRRLSHILEELEPGYARQALLHVADRLQALLPESADEIDFEDMKAALVRAYGSADVE